MARLTWLHLSDWHQKGPDFHREVVRDALVRDIREREKVDPRLAEINFIIFSGDLAFTGQSTEYESAQTYLLDPVLEATNLKADKIFCVPGNHDLNRVHITEMLPPELQKPLNSEALVHKWLNDAGRRARVLEPFEAYRKFVTGYTGQATPDYASTFHLHLDSRHIALLGLNSAWMCARNKDDQGEVNDYGYMLVGEPQIHQALEEIKKAHLRIVILHHPFDWLSEFDRFRIRARLRSKCHFILSGHEHCPDIEVSHSTAGKSLIIPAGASYERRYPEHPRYTNAYNFVYFDLDTREGTTYLRRWSDQNNEWRADTELYLDGKFIFSL